MAKKVAAHRRRPARYGRSTDNLLLTVTNFYAMIDQWKAAADLLMSDPRLPKSRKKRLEYVGAMSVLRLVSNRENPTAPSQIATLLMHEKPEAVVKILEHLCEMGFAHRVRASAEAGRDQSYLYYAAYPERAGSRKAA